MAPHAPGLSGISLYVPRPRVALERWCEWTGNAWDKVRAVVGRSFRMPARDESIYTMAANAVLRLIETYDVDPGQIGYFAFATESSTDNATGTVILKGMLDRELARRGRGRIARNCEVPELKQACLAGLYGVKGATRYLATDGRARRAIVVAGDIAEYERGSTGEQTQGAGAVAMLLEPQARLAEVDLAATGNAASYRGLDFRKPLGRHFVDGYAAATQRRHDFPVFNGKYSTTAYVDEVTAALDDFFVRRGGTRRGYWERLGALVMHRPYHHMPIQAMASALVHGMARDPADADAFVGLCAEVGVDAEAVRREVAGTTDLFDLSLEQGLDAEVMPQLGKLAKAFRGSPFFKKFVAEKMSLGADLAMELGNLYTAALPAWLAAAFDEAARREVDFAGREILAVGYGSGDAAEAVPLHVVDGWEEAARKIGVAGTLAEAVDLDREQYAALHDGTDAPGVADLGTRGFYVTSVGRSVSGPVQDVGVESYGFR
jgi:hydroxymethylglutaryl-CoA synthase